MRLLPPRLVATVLALLVAAVAVAWAAPAGAAAYPNDPYYGRQWALRRIGAPAAWKVARGKGVTIAILDTGINPTHEDLARKLVRDRFDAVKGTDRTDDFCPGFCHGTGVASVAAASTNNRLGIAGVAPDAKLMAVRVFGLGPGTNSEIISSGVMYAADHGANVINMSIGGNLLGVVTHPGIYDPTPELELAAAILYANARGVLVVVSAGNEATPLCDEPALYPGTVCVGATDGLDQPAGFTNYGARLDVMAPGVGIWMANKVGYQVSQGTSFSAPIVSGVGALLMSMGANNYTAANLIRATSKDLGLPGYDLTYGFGRVDASAAVNLCKQVC